MTPDGSGGGPGPLVFLVAGEPSGDQLGAGLMAALKAETGGRVRFAGLGGPRMAGQGLRSLFPIDQLAVMGLVEVLPHLLGIARRIRQTVAAARAARPDVLVTIDSPSFSLEVSRRLKDESFPRVHYVAPSVWAWRPWRARRMAGYLDHVLALLPFEPPYFERHGLAATFVGHPAVEAAAGAAGDTAGDPGDGAAFRARHGIADDATLLCVMPGSRRGEVRRLAPVFGAALGLLAERVRGLHAVVPTLEPVAGPVRRAVRDWPVAATVLDPGLDPEPEKLRAYGAADAGLVASGTAAVELAAAGLPSAVAYRVHPLSAVLARRLIAVDYVSIPNLVLEREVMPEFLQGACRPANLAAALERLLTDPTARQAQRAGCAAAMELLGRGGLPPSRRAAVTVLRLIEP